MAITNSVQIMQGISVCGIIVTGEQPYRDTFGRLAWQCTCNHGHAGVVLHSDLAAGHAVCAQCQAPTLQKANGIESDAQFNDWCEQHGRRKIRPVFSTPEQAAARPSTEAEAA